MNGTPCGLAFGKNHQLAKSLMALFPATVCNQNGDMFTKNAHANGHFDFWHFSTEHSMKI